MHDRHVAGEHIGEILQQPQRREVLNALASPVVQVKISVFVAARDERGAEFINVGRNQSGADMAAHARGRNSDIALAAPCGHKSGVGRCSECGRDSEFNVAAHDLRRLAVMLRDDLANREFVGGQFACKLAAPV